MIVIASLTNLARMFEAHITTVSPGLTSLFSFSFDILIVIAGKNIIIVSHLLELLLVGVLIELLLLVSIWIYTHVTILILRLFVRVTTLIEGLLLHSLVVKVLRRFVIIVNWNLA